MPKGKINRKIFDAETCALIRDVERKLNANEPIINESNEGDERRIQEALKTGVGIIVTARIPFAEAISGYRYFARVANIVVCCEYDGYTLYQVD